jgi:hypothetical protein
MSDILTGFNMQGNDPIDDRIVSKSNLETLEQYLNRVPVQKRYYGLTFFALDKNNELRKYTFQTSLIEPTIDDNEEEIERIDKELQEHVSNKAIHKTSEEIRSEIVDADIPDTIARVQWTLDQINTAVVNLIGGASDEYNTLKRIQTKIEELRAEMESQLYGDDGGTVLKTLEQALKFLNQYKDFIVDIPDNFVSKQDIVDNLTTDDPTKVLSAKQGKILSDTLTNYFESAMQSIRTETDRAINAENRIEAKLDKEIERSTNEDIRIDNKLDSEINRSIAEDDRLDKKIDAETTRATTAESNLNTKIETETDRAEGEESRIETKLDNEITRSTNKDTEHDNRLQALEGQTHEQNTDLGTTNSTFQLKYNTGNKIKHESDAISVRNAADTDYVNFIAKNATFKGDLLVEGQSFVTEAETVEIKDNLLLLNKGEVGAGVTKGIAGLEIDRGTEPNYFIVFDESDNRFKAGVEGDLWNLALRESDDNMLDGYFISWNSKDKILSTTNIVNESTPLLFGRTDYKRYSGDIVYQENVYSSYSFIDETPQGTLYNSAGESSWNIDTTKLNFRFWKPILGTTFKRASDNSEVLYHADIINDLTTGGTNKVLSAEQGKLLQNSITSIQGSYLSLSGGTMTGSIIFPNRKGIFGRLTDGTGNIKIAVVNANNNVEIGNSNTPLMLVSNSTDLTHYRDNNTYKIWDKYNLTDPVTYTTNAYNHATLKNKDGQYFTYIKAGTNGLLPHSQVTLASGGSGSLGTSDQSFNAAYINNLHTNKVTFGDAGSFINNQSGDSNHKGIGFYTSQNAACPVYVGSLCVSDGYANSAPNIPANGIYSKGIIYIENGIGFRNSIWTNDLTPNRNYSGYLQVLDAYYDAAKAVGPTNYGTVLQINSRRDHWANQLWFGNNNNMYLRRMNYGSTTYGEWNRLLTNKDVNILPASYKNDPNSLPINQIFYAETQGVTGTPTGNGLLFSVQGNDEGIQLWAGDNRRELYYRTKWVSYGNWIKLATTSDLNSYLTKTEASTLYYPYNGRGYLSITSSGRPVMSNNQGYAVKDKDGNEREVLWMGPDNSLNLGNTNAFTLNLLNLRCTTLTYNGNKIATEYYVTNQLANYLPLSGGILSGNLTINTVGSTTLVINNNDTNGSETFMRVLRKGTASAAIGFMDSLGAYIYNYNSNKYLFIDNDGYARVGTTNGSTRLALITDIPTVSGYLPLSGGTMSGNISFNGSTGHIVVGARETSNYVSAVSFNKGSATNSAHIGYHSTGGSDSSGALVLVPYPTSANAWAKTVGLYIAKNELLLDGKAIATQEYVNNRSVSWSNITGKPSTYTPSAHSHNSLQIEDNRDVTMLPNNMGPTTLRTFFNANRMPTSNWYSGIHISGWTTNYAAWQLCGPSSNNTTTASSLYFRSGKDSTWNSWKKIAFTSDIPTNTSHLTNDSGFITSSALNGYATQSWANGQFAPLKNYFVTNNYASIATKGNEMCIGSLTSGNSIINVNYRNGTGTTSPSTWYWRAGSPSSWANAYWGNLYMNNNLVATQTWSNSQYPLKTGAGASGTWDINISGNASTASTATNASQLGGTAAASYVKANDNISRLTNDSGYTTQEWVNGQGFLTSDSLLDKFVPTTGGYIRNSDQVLLRLQRTGVSTGTSRTIEMYFDDSNTDGTSTTPRGSIGYNSEVGMFLYSAKSKKFLAMEYTGRPFYGTPENRYYLLGSNTEYHNLDGYQRIGDIMIQWGYFTVQGNSTRAVNFPVSFTNTVWSVTGSWDNTTTSNQENWGFTNYTSSGFTIINGDGSSRIFHYIAIGPFTRS